MQTKLLKKLTLFLSTAYFLCLSIGVSAQETPEDMPKSNFWNHVQFGGGFGLGIGSGYTDITIAPSAIYNFNQYIALGAGLQGSFLKSKNQYSSNVYGASVIGLFNPVEQVQLSLEVEQVRVNTTFETIPNRIKDNFWNTGLFIGAGYRTENITIGVRYNLLFDEDKSVYSDALMPFIRVYF